MQVAIHRGSPANDRQRAAPFDVQNYTPIKGLIYFTVFTALSLSILAFALVPQLRVDDQNFNSSSGIVQPVSQAITTQATPATELAQTIELDTETQDGGDPVNILEQAVETDNKLDQPLELTSSAMELTAAELAETSGSAKETESTGEQVSVQEPVDVSANGSAQLPKPSVPALELATTESSEELAPETGLQLSFELKSNSEEVAEVTERQTQQFEPMTPHETEMVAIADFDAENQNLPESISDIESTANVGQAPAQQAELTVVEPQLAQVAESVTDNQSLEELVVPVESMVQIEADHVRQVEQIQPELAVVTDSDIDAQQSGGAASNHKSLEHIETDSNQGSRSLQSATTELPQVAAVMVFQQSHVEPVSDTESIARIDEESVEKPKPAVPVLEPLAIELAAIADFDAESQNLPESISDIESTAYVEEAPEQQVELAAPELGSLETELTQVAESVTDGQTLDELAVSVEPEVQFVAEIEQIQSELAVVAGAGKDAQISGESVSEREAPVSIEIEQNQGSSELQPVTTQLVSVAAVDISQQSYIEPTSNTEPVARIGEKSVDQSQPAVPVLEQLTTELVAIIDFDAENQNLPESISDIELLAYAGDLVEPEPASLETELTQVANSVNDDQSLEGLVLPAELVVQVELEHEQQVEQIQPELTIVSVLGMEAQETGEPASSRQAPEYIEAESDQRFNELQPATTQLARVTEVDVAQLSHIEPISDTEPFARIVERSVDQSQPAEPTVEPVETELAKAAEPETNDEGLGGPISDYEQALQLDQQPNQQSQPDVSILEPVSGEEKLVPTGVAEPVILLSTDLESLANAPVVLTESNVRPGDTLSSIFKRNNLSYKIAQRLISAPGSNPVSVLYPRDHLKFVWSNNKLLGIELRRKNKLSLMATYDGRRFTVINIREARRAGTIVKLLKQEIESVEREDLIDYETQYAKLKSTNLKWSTITVKKGDALSKIFRRTGLSAVEAIAVAGYPGNEWLATGLKPGQEMNIAKSEEGKFAILEVPEKGTAKVRLVFPVEGGYFVGFKKIKAEIQEHYACAEVKSSLYTAGYAINIPREVMDEFVSVFESRFDFSRQLQQGDQFCIIYDREYIKGKPLKEINIKAGSLIQEDAELHAFRHVDDDDRVAYYDSEGLNMQGHFLQSPIKSARVVSRYSKRRYHPVLKISRPHLGVDYGARTGTPIRSTATGQVIKRGWSGGYGQMIIIQHGSKYRTLYAHMSRYADGTSVGSYVKQGQVIGFVGSTGLSTGPHLHYEFHVNGRHRDPLQYDMPKGQPIPEQYKVAFQTVVDEFSKRLASIDAPQVEYRPSTVQTASSQ